MDDRCPVHPDHPRRDCRGCELDVAATDPKTARQVPLRELVEHFKAEHAQTTDTTGGES